MIEEKKPRRRLGRRQKYLRVPIGVNFRQLHLQRAVSTTFRRMKVRMTVMEMKMKRVKKSIEKDKVELSEMEAKIPQLRAKRMHALEEKIHALEESAWSQACYDVMEALFLCTVADQLHASLRLSIFP